MKFFPDSGNLTQNLLKFPAAGRLVISILKKLRLPYSRIIVESQRRIFIFYLMNAVKLHSKMISLQENDVIRVAFSDGLCHFQIKLRQHIRSVDEIGLIQHIVTQKIFLLLIMFCNITPEGHDLIPEHFVMPKLGDSRIVIGMPVRILPARRCMKV